MYSNFELKPIHDAKAVAPLTGGVQSVTTEDDMPTSMTSILPRSYRQSQSIPAPRLDLSGSAPARLSRIGIAATFVALLVMGGGLVSGGCSRRSAPDLLSFAELSGVQREA